MFRLVTARLSRAILLLSMVACGGGDGASGPTPGGQPVTIALSQSTLSLVAGQTQQLAAAVAGSANTTVSWSTSAPAIATVSTTGAVTGVAPGTATITATSVADPSRSASAAVTVSAASTGTGSDATALVSGVPLAGQGGAENSQRLYRVLVPAGASRLEVRTAGGTGDLDLYLRAGAPPSASGIDCSSEGGTNDELCVVDGPTPGEWYVLVHGFEAYSGASITATVTTGTGGVPGTPAIAIAASPATVSLAQGGSAALSVAVTRSGGYTGAVTVSAEGLPAGVTASGLTIASGATSGTLTLTAAATASGSATVTLRARGTGVADATAGVPLTVSTPTGGGGSGTIGISFSQPSLRIEQNTIGSTYVRIQRNGYTGSVELSMDAVPATEHFIIPLFEKTLLGPGETETLLRLRVHHNFGSPTTSVRIRARTAAGVETTAELPITIPMDYVFKGGFTAASWRMYTISSAGDRCEYLVGMSGTVTITANGLHQTSTMTTRIQGTMESKAVQASVGQTNCNSGSTSIDVSKTTGIMFPSLNNMVERKFTSWGVQFWVESRLKEATDTFNPGNSPTDSRIRLQITGSSTAGIVGDQPVTLDLGLLRQQ